MYAAAGPSPAPPSPWQPAHHFTYTRLPAVVSCAAGERVEAGGEVPLAVEMVAVARQTVPVVDAFPLREVRGERVRVLAQRVLESRQRDRLAPEGDLGGRRRMDRP